MKAIVQDMYGSPDDVLEIRDIGIPVINDDEVLVRVRAAAVNPPDWASVTGVPYIARIASGLRKPRNGVRGSDVAGTVAAVGTNVTGLQVGDEVFGSGAGTFAEYAVASETNLVRKPATVTFEQAAGVPMSGLTALQALRDQGQVRPGQKVLINGAGGGIGTFAVQIAKTFGADVTGVCSTAKVDLVRSLGVDQRLVPHRPVLRPPRGDVRHRESETALPARVAALVTDQVDLHLPRVLGPCTSGPPPAAGYPHDGRGEKANS